MSENATEVKALVEGGKATPGPPLGPALGPLRINVKAVIDAINEKTQEFAGMKVPIVVRVFADKSFEIVVKTPQASALLIKEAGLPKGAQTHEEPVGDISFESLLKVVALKRDQLLGGTLKMAIKEILSTCITCGLTVDGVPAREMQLGIDAGDYDHKIPAE